jgi:hypothetical protein
LGSALAAVVRAETQSLTPPPLVNHTRETGHPRRVGYALRLLTLSGYQLLSNGLGRRVSAVASPELGLNLLEVAAHGLLTEAEPLGDLPSETNRNTASSRGVMRDWLPNRLGSSPITCSSRDAANPAAAISRIRSGGVSKPLRTWRDQ